MRPTLKSTMPKKSMIPEKLSILSKKVVVWDVFIDAENSSIFEEGNSSSFGKI